MKIFSVNVGIASAYGEDYELEQALMDLLALNQLLPTREGKVIDASLFEINVKEESTDKDEEDDNRIMDEPVKNKKNHWK